jgi:hypothetical protein
VTVATTARRVPPMMPVSAMVFVFMVLPVMMSLRTLAPVSASVVFAVAPVSMSIMLARVSVSMLIVYAVRSVAGMFSRVPAVGGGGRIGQANQANEGGDKNEVVSIHSESSCCQSGPSLKGRR